ncbi:major facilitator superfamily MFS_1 [Emticicia oligotrophica DSM 17448]|uniref:Major facilitator superfamily MFS_1 n=1 Tax=Emticicia oligotrophica (strain DSM 17448 / CIP 109782 / MTCC 6937 / GPTSA100-15) TaxID=929562 RepID=A0ABM5N1K4_EMTOG|nr:MFS transporter [Emticicia oligotrophica]AFK03276.1 major facilitator superfamily MFS_1 [Emticicia oligotrophica DSM 17448]
MTQKEKLLLFILACINFTHIIDFMIMMPLGPQLIKIFDISPRQFGFIVSAYGLSAGISGFLSAFFVDNYDRKKVVLFAYTGFVAGTVACAFAPTFEILILTRTIAGTFGGLIGSQVLSIVADTFEYERRATAMGFITTAFSLASVVGIPSGLYLASHFGWHSPFLVLGVLGIVVIFLISRFVPVLDKHLRNKQHKQNPFEAITNIAKNPNQLRALSLSTIIMLGHFSIIPYISPTLVSNVGYSQDNIFLIYFVGGLLTIFSAPMVGKLADRKGKYPVFVTFAILSMLPIFLITNMFSGELWIVLIIAGIFFVFSNGRLIPTQAIISNVVTPQQRGSFMAINSSVQLLAQAIATNIGGFIIHKTPSGFIENYPYVGYFSMLMIFFSIFIAKTVKSITQ